LPLADQASQKAVELDDTSSDAHVARANALGTAWKWSAADLEFRRAIELNPNNANAHYFYAFNDLMPTNHLEEALDQFRLALALDPLAPIVRTNYALTLMDAHKYPEAQEQFDQILQRDPGFGPALFYLSQMQATRGQWADAVSTLRKGAPPNAFLGRSWSLDAKGYAEFMDAISNGSLPADAAVAYSLAGNRDKAFDNLEKAYADRDDEITAVIRFPAFDHLKSDPRWPALLQKLNVPQ
jgi:tetratricopeptide (TPR) repeat protein